MRPLRPRRRLSERDDDDRQQRGEKGKSFRGGSKDERDNWYGFNDKDFQRWWHREGKAAMGGRDIENREQAQAAYDHWVQLGRPKVS